jgi:hypothetical protein
MLQQIFTMFTIGFLVYIFLLEQGGIWQMNNVELLFRPAGFLMFTSTQNHSFLVSGLSQFLMYDIDSFSKGAFQYQTKKLLYGTKITQNQEQKQWLEVNLKKASRLQQKLNARQTNRAPTFSLVPPALCFVSFTCHCPVLASASFCSSFKTPSVPTRGFLFLHKKPLVWNRGSQLSGTEKTRTQVWASACKTNKKERRRVKRKSWSYASLSLLINQMHKKTSLDNKALWFSLQPTRSTPVGLVRGDQSSMSWVCFNAHPMRD